MLEVIDMHDQVTKKKNDDRELAVRWQLEVWEGQNSRLSELLYELTDEQLEKQIAPGRNTGIYILGHLAAVNDGMMPLLGLGERHYPYLEEKFLANPQNLNDEQPSASEVRKVWAELLGALRANFDRLSPNEWFHKHTAVSEEEFADEPHRNRLNVLISRTNHVSYHLGQLNLLKNKGEDRK
jgi:hypothetical protein